MIYLLHSLTHTHKTLKQCSRVDLLHTGHIAGYVSIRELVDSLCRDGVDIPMPPYIGKAFTHTNVEE